MKCVQRKSSMVGLSANQAKKQQSDNFDANYFDKNAPLLFNSARCLDSSVGRAGD